MTNRDIMTNSAASGLKFPRFSIGTAQFGIPSYGIANRVGKPPYEALREIVRRAFECGATGLDTAAEYGESENLLGRILEELELKQAAFVCSKISHLEVTEDGRFVRKSVIRSLRRLRLETLPLCMLHRAEHLEYTDALIALKEEGLIRYAGVSVYTPEQAVQAIETPGIDAIQHPLCQSPRYIPHPVTRVISPLWESSSSRLSLVLLVLVGKTFPNQLPPGKFESPSGSSASAVLVARFATD